MPRSMTKQSFKWHNHSSKQIASLLVYFFLADRIVEEARNDVITFIRLCEELGGMLR